MDIDFAIDDMKGEEFVTLMNEYLHRSTGIETRGFGVTRFNPEKSKHLETAKVKILDVWIDVVNLRGEVYDPNSRIPQIVKNRKQFMKFEIFVPQVNGTPEQDAYRRDLTINSLFYNLNTKSIEDFTKKVLFSFAATILLHIWYRASKILRTALQGLHSLQK